MGWWDHRLVIGEVLVGSWMGGGELKPTILKVLGPGSCGHGCFLCARRVETMNFNDRF